MNQSPQSSDSFGYLLVKVTTASGAIPLENASVRLRGSTPESSGVFYATLTNSDGQTERISLPTPPFSASQTPTGGTPYAQYSLEVRKEGYLPLSLENIPVCPSILSIQPAVMIPSAEGVIA